MATAEKRDGRWAFAIAGQPFAAGHAEVPPQQVLFEIGSITKVRAIPNSLLAMLTGQQALPVFRTGKDRFEYDVVEAALTFERDAAGKVTAVVLHQSGLDRRATRRPAA